MHKRPAHTLALRIGLALVTLAALGCGGDSGAGARGNSSTRRDGGEEDAGQSPMRLDAALEPDSGNGISVGGRYLCSFDDDDRHAFEASREQSELSMAVNARGFALVHHGEDGSLWIEAVGVGEPAQAPVRLIDGSDAPGRALLAASGQRFSLAWQQGASLFVRVLATGHAPLELTAELASPKLVAFIGVADGFLVAYVAGAEQAGGARVRVQRLDEDAQPRAEAVSVALPEGSTPEQLSLASLDGGRVLLAYVESDPDSERADATRVQGLVLDPSLAEQGSPATLSKSPGSELQLALDARAGSAGLIYQALEGGVRPTIKLQRIDGDGRAPQDSLNVASAPRRVLDGSITAFGQGYAVAYRALPSLGMEQAVIRIAFVNPAGLVVYDAELASANEARGPTSVRSTPDGKLLVAWQSAGAPGATSVQAVALDCPGALILCGGQLD